ncbi:MAG: GNAT family N-acetyltransferase [Trueperaceae bacterium]
MAELRVDPLQERFSRSALFSIAEAQFYPAVRLKAVLGAEGRPVGLVMYGIDDEDWGYRIFRLLIASGEQRKGYGRAVVQMVINELAPLPDCQEVWLRYYRTTKRLKNSTPALGSLS